MNLHMIIHLFLLACMITFAIPESVLAATGSEELPVSLSDNLVGQDLTEPDSGISTPGTSVVEIAGINAVNYPQVITYVTVNTPAGRSGELKKEDFQVFENGDVMDVTLVQFPDSSSQTKLDLAIVFDDTGSMSNEIADLKAKVNEMTDKITAANIDCRYSLISFHDAVTIRQQWTSDPAVMKSAVDGLSAQGGDDASEVDLDAIEAALEMGFRPDAQHMILDITDSTTHYRNDGTPFSQYTIEETAGHLMSNGTSYILVGPASDSGIYNVYNDKKEIVKALGGSGLFIDIHSDNFSVILDTIQSIITQTYTIGYSSPNQMSDGKKITVKVIVGSDSDSGQYSSIMRDGADDTPPEQNAEKTGDTNDSLSILGTSVVDITGINAVNFPYINTYVIVNTGAGKTGQLTQDDFLVFEDGIPVNITSFSFPDKSTGTSLDLAILFDDTGSLRDEIADMKAKVNELTERINSANIDCRYSLISFKDTVSVQQNWTSDPTVIRNAIDGLNASEGFDDPEVNLDAIETALESGFRPDAQHMILDITDATTHYRDDGTPFSKYTIAETAAHLLSNGTSYILVGPTTVPGTFDSNNDKRELVKALGGSGLFIDIHGDDFPVILENIQGVITQTYIIGYYSPKPNLDGSKRTVEVQVDTESDTGQYVALVS